MAVCHDDEIGLTLSLPHVHFLRAFMVLLYIGKNIDGHAPDIVLTKMQVTSYLCSDHNPLNTGVDSEPSVGWRKKRL
jgi:hypothetical protein